MTQVKWLRSITITDRPFTGYQNSVAYRLKQDPGDAGTPVTRIRPRALIQPPGFPDFMSRARFLHPGEHTITGRAWSGTTPVTRVDISVDGGRTWQPTQLEPPAGRWAWSRWTYHWHLDQPGTYQLVVRARDELTDQSTEQGWNLQGMANNMAHRITVHAIPPT